MKAYYHNDIIKALFDRAKKNAWRKIKDIDGCAVVHYCNTSPQTKKQDTTLMQDARDHHLIRQNLKKITGGK